MENNNFRIPFVNSSNNQNNGSFDYPQIVKSSFNSSAFDNLKNPDALTSHNLKKEKKDLTELEKHRNKLKERESFLQSEADSSRALMSDAEESGNEEQYEYYKREYNKRTQEAEFASNALRRFDDYIKSIPEEDPIYEHLSTLSEEKQKEAFNMTNDQIVNMFVKDIANQYMSNGDKLKNTKNGDALIKRTILPGISFIIPKFDVNLQTEQGQLALFGYIKTSIYQQLNDKFENDNPFKSLYGAIEKEEIEADANRYSKELGEFIYGQRNEAPKDMRRQRNFHEDLLAYLMRKDSRRLTSKEMYANALFSSLKDVDKKIESRNYAQGVIDKKADYVEGNTKFGHLGGPVWEVLRNTLGAVIPGLGYEKNDEAIVGGSGEINTIIYNRATVDKKVFNDVENSASDSGSMVIMSTEFNKLKYKDISGKREVKLDEYVKGRVGNISDKEYNIVKNNIKKGNLSKSDYNDNQLIAYNIMKEYVDKEGLLTDNEVSIFKKSVVKGGDWFGSLYLGETNWWQRTGAKTDNRGHSDSVFDETMSVTLDDGSVVKIKEDRAYWGINFKSTTFEKMKEANSIFESQSLTENAINNAMTKNSIEVENRKIEEEDANNGTDVIGRYKNVIETNAITKIDREIFNEERQRLSEKSSKINPFGEALHAQGEANRYGMVNMAVVDWDIFVVSEKEKILSIDLNSPENKDKDSFDFFSYKHRGKESKGESFSREELSLLQRYIWLEYAGKNNDEAIKLLSQIEDGAFWRNAWTGFKEGMLSIDSSYKMISMNSKERNYYFNEDNVMERALAEKYRGSIIAGDYNHALKLEANKDNEVIASVTPVMSDAELFYLNSVQNKSQAMNDWSDSASLLTRIGETTGTSTWFMIEMGLTWGLYGGAMKGLQLGAKGIMTGLEHGATKVLGKTALREATSFSQKMLYGARGFASGTLKVGSKAAGYFGDDLGKTVMLKIAQMPARLIQNSIANIAIAGISPSTANFIIEDMNSRGRIRYIDVNGQMIPVGHSDVAAYLHDLNDYNLDYLEKIVFTNTDKTLKFFGYEDVKEGRSEIAEELKNSYRMIHRNSQKDLILVRDRKTPQIYESIMQGIYSQTKERFTETFIGGGLDFVLGKTIGKVTGKITHRLEKNLVINPVDAGIKTNFTKRFFRNLTGAKTVTGGTFAQRTGFHSMNFLNNYIFGHATAKGFINSPLSEIGEEVFGQLLPEKVFSIPEGSTILSLYRESFQELASERWWQEVSSSVLLTTSVMGGLSRVGTSFNESLGTRIAKPDSEIKLINKMRSELENKIKNEGKAKGLSKESIEKKLNKALNEFDSKNKTYTLGSNKKGETRRMRQSLERSMLFGTEEEMLSKWSAANAFGPILGQAEIEHLSGWVDKVNEDMGLESNSIATRSLLMRKMINNISYAFSQRGESGLELLESLRTRYVNTFGMVKKGKKAELRGDRLMYDILTEQIDYVKNFDEKMQTIVSELTGKDKVTPDDIKAELGFALPVILESFHKARHASVEITSFRNAIERMFQEESSSKKKQAILETLNTIDEITKFFFNEKYSLNVNNKTFKKTHIAFSKLSQQIESLKTHANEKELLTLTSFEQLRSRYQKEYSSYLISSSRLNQIREDSQRATILDYLERGYKTEAIKKHFGTKLSKGNLKFLNNVTEQDKDRAKRSSNLVDIKQLGDGVMVVDMTNQNQARVLKIDLNKRKGYISLIDSKGNVVKQIGEKETVLDRYWSATNKETSWYARKFKDQSKAKKKTSSEETAPTETNVSETEAVPTEQKAEEKQVDKETIVPNEEHRPEFNPLVLPAEVMRNWKTARKFLEQWIRNEKKNLKRKGKKEHIADLLAYAEVAEKRIKEYFLSEQSDDINLNDYGYDTTAKMNTPEAPLFNFKDGDKISTDITDHIERVKRTILNKIKDKSEREALEKKFKEQGKITTIKALRDFIYVYQYAEIHKAIKERYGNTTFNGKSISIIYDTIIDEMIQQMMGDTWQYGFSLRAIIEEHRNSDITQPIELDEDYIFYNGQVLPKKDFDKVAYDSANNINSETGLKNRDTELPKVTVEGKSSRERIREYNEQKHGKEKTRELEEQQGVDIKEDVSQETKEVNEVEEPEVATPVVEATEETPVVEVKEETPTETLKEATPIEQEKQEATAPTEETKEETPITETKEEAPVKEEKSIEEIAKEHDIDITDDNTTKDSLLESKENKTDKINDDAFSFVENEFSHLGDLEKEFNRATKELKESILKIAKYIKENNLVTWDEIVQALCNIGFIEENITLNQIEKIRYAASLAKVITSKNEITTWFKSVTDTNFSTYLERKFKQNSFDFVVEDLEDVVKWEKDDTLLHPQLNKHEKKLEDSPFEVISKQGKKYIDANGNVVTDENHAVVPYQFGESETSGLFMRVAVHWDENGVPTDYLYIELPRQNLKYGLEELTSVFNYAIRRKSFGDDTKKAWIRLMAMSLNIEIDETFRKHLEALDLNSEPFKSQKKGNGKMVLYSKEKGFVIENKKSVNLYDVKIPFKTKSYTSGGVTVKTIDGLMSLEQLQEGGFTIKEMLQRQSELTEAVNKIEQEKKVQMGKMLEKTKREIVKDVIQKQLKNLKDRNISLATMFIDMEERINDFVEKEFSTFTERERTTIKEQMLGLQEGTYINSVAEELASVLSLSEEGVRSLLRRIHSYKKAYERRDIIKEVKEGNLPETELDSSSSLAKWLERHSNIEELSLEEFQKTLFNLADNQLSSEQKLSRIVGLALYGIEYVNSQGETVYFSVGEALQLFVGFYTMGAEGYNISFSEAHNRVMEILTESKAMDSESIKGISALFKRIESLRVDYGEFGESIINELYSKMDVEKITFLTLENKLDQDQDIFKSMMKEIGVSDAVAKIEAGMLRNAVRSGLLEVVMDEHLNVEKFLFNEDVKGEALRLIKKIREEKDIKIQIAFANRFFRLIGFDLNQDAIKLLLENTEIDVNELFSDYGVFANLLTKTEKGEAVGRLSLLSSLKSKDFIAYEIIQDIINATTIYEEQSFWDRNKLYYNLKTKSHTDDVNSLIKYGDESVVDELLSEKQSIISKLLLENKEFRKELETKRLSNDTIRVIGAEYSQNFNQLTPENKRLVLLKIFLSTKRSLPTDISKTDGIPVVSFIGIGTTQSNYDVFDLNRTLGFDFTEHISYENGKIILSNKALEYLTRNLFLEDAYRIQKFQKNKDRNMREMSDVGKMFMNIRELNSYIANDGETLNYKVSKATSETELLEIYEQYKNIINNFFNTSLQKEFSDMTEVQQGFLRVKGYSIEMEGHAEYFSTDTITASNIGNFILNQMLAFNSSVSLYFDDMNDLQIKKQRIFAGGNINKRMLDLDEYAARNNPFVYNLAKEMLETKDMKKQEELWDAINDILPHNKILTHPDGYPMFEQNAINYADEALKVMTNRARKLRSPSVRIFKGQSDEFFQKETYSVLQLKGNAIRSSLLHRYMELFDVGTKEERKIIEEAIATNNFTEEAVKIEEKYKDVSGFKEYNDMNEADGEEYESWRFRLQTLLSSGEITKSQFKELETIITTQFKELIDNGEVSTSIPEWAQIHFHVRKPLQVANVNGRGVYIKSSSVPLIPTLIAGSEYLIKMAVKLDHFEREHKTIARVATEFAVKQGQISEENAITDDNILNDKYVFSQNNAINDITLYSFGNQVENPQKTLEEMENNFATQVFKMLTSGVVVSTETKDFHIGNESYTGRELNELYTKVVTNLSNRKLESFLTDFGIMRNIETGNYIINAKSRFYRRIRDKISNALMYNSTRIDFEYIYVDEQGNRITSKKELGEESYRLESISFDTELWQQDIKGALETVLMSEVRDYAVRHKVSGSQLKVMSSLGFNGMVKPESGYTNADIENQNKILLTSEYSGRIGVHEENGIMVHHVLVPRDIKIEIDGEIIELDLTQHIVDGEIVLPKNISTRFTWRVPLSGIQSSSLVKIVGFLPKEMGNTMVTSTESAIQLGEDFDFDTRFQYTTVYNDHNGDYNSFTMKKEDYDKLSNDQKISALNNTLIDIYKSVLESTNKEVQQVAHRPISVDVMLKTRDAIESNKKKSRYKSHLGLGDQLEQMENGSISMLGVALASLYNSTQSALNLAGVQSRLNSIFFTVGNAYRNPSTGQTVLKFPEIVFGKTVLAGPAGFSSKTWGTSRFVSEKASELQNLFVDDQKHAAMTALGISEETINQYLTMTLLLGMDLEDGIDYSSVFMQMPVIKEYVRMHRNYINENGYSKKMYKFIHEEIAKKYLDEATFNRVIKEKNREGYFEEQKKLRTKYGKQLTVKKMLELSRKEVLDEEEKKIMYAAYLNFVQLSYISRHSETLNRVFGFEKNIVRKTYSSFENATDEVVQILKGSHDINKSIVGLDKLFGEMISREDVLQEELKLFREAKARNNEEGRKKAVELMREKLDQYIYIGLIDGKHQYIKPANAITARILSTRAYTGIFKNELLYKQPEFLEVYNKINYFLNSSKMSNNRFEKLNIALHRFVLGVSFDKIADSVATEGFELSNGKVIDNKFLNELLGEELHNIITVYASKNRWFGGNLFIKSLTSTLTRGQTDLSLTLNTVDTNSRAMREALLSLYNNVDNLENSGTGSMIKYKGNKYTARDIAVMIFLYTLKTNNSTIYSLMPQEFKDTIDFSKRLKNSKIENQNDLNSALNLLDIRNLVKGKYKFNMEYKKLLTEKLDAIGVEYSINKNEVTITNIPEHSNKNYADLFLKQNSIFVRHIDKETHTNLLKFFNKELVQRLLKEQSLTFTQSQMQYIVEWSSIQDVTMHKDTGNTQYFKFNIPVDKFVEDKLAPGSDLMVIGFINPETRSVTFELAQDKVNRMEAPRTADVNTHRVVSDTVVNHKKYERVTKYIDPEVTTLYLTASGLGTVNLSDRIVKQMKGDPNFDINKTHSWWRDSGGFLSLYTTSLRSASQLAGILFENAIKEMQTSGVTTLAEAQVIIDKHFTKNNFLGFDEEGEPLMEETFSGKERRAGIHKTTYRSSKNVINKLTSEEERANLAGLAFKYVIEKKGFVPFDVLQEKEILTETAITIETKYGKVVLKSIPDQVEIKDDVVNIIDIKFLQKNFKDIDEVREHIESTYLQHIAYQYHINEVTGKPTTFSYGVFTNLGYVEVKMGGLTKDNKHLFHQKLEEMTKKALDLFENIPNSLMNKNYYADALTFEMRGDDINKGTHKRLIYAKDEQFQSLSEITFNEDGTLGKFFDITDDMREAERNAIREIAQSDMEIIDKNSFFDEHIKEKDSPFTSALREVFKKATVIITNGKSRYNKKTNTIYINRNQQDTATVLEEVIHAATAPYIDKFVKSKVNWNTLSVEYEISEDAPQEIRDLMELYKESFADWVSKARENLTEEEFTNLILDLKHGSKGLRFKGTELEVGYDVSNVYEFMASLWKNNDTAKFLNLKDTRGWLEKIWDAILKVLGVVTNQKDVSSLSELVTGIVNDFVFADNIGESLKRDLSTFDIINNYEDRIELIEQSLKENQELKC